MPQCSKEELKFCTHNTVLEARVYISNLREVLKLENVQSVLIGLDWNILQSNQLTRSD